MDTNFLISSDFIVSTMIEYMTVHQLLWFRQITSKLYTLIDINLIEGLVISKTQGYIKNVAGDKYNSLIKIVQKCKGSISGRWLAMLIYGEIKNMVINSDFDSDNIEGIINHYGLKGRNMYNGWDEINGYSLFEGKIIFKEGRDPIEIFQNTIQIVDDNKWHFEIGNINKLVNKRETIDLCSTEILKLVKKCTKCDIQLSIRRVTSYDLKFLGSMLGFYDETYIMVLGCCIPNIGKIINIQVMNHPQYSSVVLTINKVCNKTDCVLNILQYEHIHTDLQNNAMRISVVLVKYILDCDIFVDVKRDIIKWGNYIDGNKYHLEKMQINWRKAIRF